MIAPEGPERTPGGELTDDEGKKKLSDGELLQNLTRKFEDSSDARAEWAAKARESQKFVGGKQWSDADLKKLTKERRPAITINRVLSTVLFLEGLQRTQRTEPTLLPFEADDVRPTELMNALYKWTSTQCREPVIDDRVFRNKIVTGLGWWKAVLNYYDDVNPTPGWEAPNPLSIFPDPNFWSQCSMSDVDYVQHATWVTEDEAVDRFPDSKAEIRSKFGEWLKSGGHSTLAGADGEGELAGDHLSEERTWWDNRTKRTRLLETWYLRRIKTKIAIVDPDTDGERIIDDLKQVRRIEEMLRANPMFSDRVQVIEKTVRRCRVAYMIDGVLLDDAPSPWDEQCLPFFPTAGYQYDDFPFGPVEVQKDPQREHNRRRSTIMELIARTPQSGFFNKRSGGARNEDLENYSNGNGSVIPYETDKPEPINPPQVPPAVAYLDSRSASEILEVVNVNPELLGTTSQKTVSGRAISARQRSAVVVQEPLLESFRQDKEPAVRFMVKAIQQWVTVPRALRILGSIVMQGTRLEGMAQVAATVGDMQAQVGQFELAELMQNAMLTTFDVIIDTNKPFDASVHLRTLEIFTDLVEKFGPMAIPPTVLVDAFKNAGLLSEKNAMEILQWQQQQLGMAQQQAEPQPAPQGDIPV